MSQNLCFGSITSISVWFFIIRSVNLDQTLYYSLSVLYGGTESGPAAASADKKLCKAYEHCNDYCKYNKCYLVTECVCNIERTFEQAPDIQMQMKCVCAFFWEQTVLKESGQQQQEK